MDLSRYPLEKLLYFVAGVIPGAVALLIYEVAVPGAFDWLFRAETLGYRTKLALALLVAFVVGNSITRFLSGILGAIASTFGYLSGQKAETLAGAETAAPWRDPRWRSALRRYLGPETPKDTLPIPESAYQWKLKAADLQPVGPEREIARRQVELEVLNAKIEDGKWAQWYRHYHSVVLAHAERDVTYHVQTGLGFNMEAASVYTLVSAILVPDIRHWWCIVPPIFWCLMLTAELYSNLANWRNLFSTLDPQIRYITGLAVKQSDSLQAGAGR